MDTVTSNEPDPDDAAKPEKNLHAVALGRLGGKKGGPVRSQKLTPEQRREIARKAAGVRWAVPDEQEPP